MMRGVVVPVLVATSIVAAGTGAKAAPAGPCRGESLGGRRVDALVVGSRSHEFTKMIFGVTSSPEGSVNGQLILHRGPARETVTSWCRLWVGGEGRGEVSHGDVVHILGEATFSDGSRQYVRVDVSPEGRVRVRARAVTGDDLGDDHGDDHSGGHDSGHVSVAATGDDGHDDAVHGGWRSLTGEGWISATRARIGTTGGRTPWPR